MQRLLSVMPCYRASYLKWIILIFAALNVIFLGGKRRAFGGFVAVLHKDFSNISLTELNWIGDSYAALGYMTSGLSTAIILYFSRRYGLFQLIGSIFVLLSCITSSFVPNPHWLFLTHTLLHGIGSSLIISTVGLVVNEHFYKNHPYHLLATTLVSGGSVASIVFVAFFAFLIEQYSWRTAFLILGVLYFIVNASASIFFVKNDELTETGDRKKLSCSGGSVSSRQVPLMVLWFVDRIMTSVVTYGLLLNLTDYIHRTGINLVSSTVMTTLFAAGEASTYLIGAIITGVTKDFFKGKLRYILFGTSIIMAASLVALEFSVGSISGRRSLCFIAGFAMGPSITFLFPGGEECTRLPGHIAYPFSLGGMGFGMMLSPLLTAKIAETFAYKWFFLVQGGLICIKCSCLLMIILLLHYYERNPLAGYGEDESESEVELEVEEERLDETAELILDPKGKYS